MDGTRKYYAEQGNQGPWIEKNIQKSLICEYYFWV